MVGMVLLLLLFALSSSFCSTLTRTLSEWHTAQRSISTSEFNQILETYITHATHRLTQATWFGRKLLCNDKEFYNYKNPTRIRPYVAKKTMRTHSTVYLWGDLHGDLDALLTSLYRLCQDGIIDDAWRIQAPHTYFVFLGDLVDRGSQGPEIMYLVLTLAVHNPDTVILIRGNHEDVSINNTCFPSFTQQIRALFPRRAPEHEYTKTLGVLNCVYNLLPVAVFIGCGDNYVQCCHGGLEPRYNPQDFLNQKADYQAITKLTSCVCENNLFLEPLAAANMHTLHMGFMWNDFNAHTDPVQAQLSHITPNRGLMIGRTLCEQLLHLYSAGNAQVRGCIRGHQHNYTMPGLLDPRNLGIFSLWDNTVFTLVSTRQFGTPTAFLKLTLHDSFSEWQLTQHAFALPGWYAKSSSFAKWHNASNPTH